MAKWIVGSVGVFLVFAIAFVAAGVYSRVDALFAGRTRHTAGVTLTKPDGANLMQSVLMCAGGDADQCLASSGAMTALAEAGTPVRLCAVWGDTSQCMEMEAPGGE